MSQPSNGITPEVIRQVMPPYELSPDLRPAIVTARAPAADDQTRAALPNSSSSPSAPPPSARLRTPRSPARSRRSNHSVLIP